jgi:hypothetical protein
MSAKEFRLCLRLSTVTLIIFSVSLGLETGKLMRFSTTCSSSGAFDSLEAEKMKGNATMIVA